MLEMLGIRGLVSVDVRRMVGRLALVGVLAFAGGALALPSHVAAAPPSRMITVGESNDESQRAELLDYFGAHDDDTVVTITVDDTKQAMDGIFDLSGVETAYSSTALTCEDPGTGLNVSTRNIQAVPPELYAMTLVTAGIQDATLVVAAPDDAAALGMTALTGVFQAWDETVCNGSTTSPERQRLALEELALTAEIGQALDVSDGMTRAANLVIETQKAILANGFHDPAGIEQALSDQERTAGFEVPGEQRDRLLAFLTRLAAADLDWGQYAAGWAITHDPDKSEIRMTGKGETRRPRLEQNKAPSDVGGETMATPAATPATPIPATPAAATPLAVGPLTATAPPLTVVGTVIDRAPGQLAVIEEGSDNVTVAYPIPGSAKVYRIGSIAPFTAVTKGDKVRMMIDRETGEVAEVHAEPAASTQPEARSRLSLAGWLIPIGVLSLAVIFLLARQSGNRSFWLPRPVPRPRA